MLYSTLYSATNQLVNKHGLHVPKVVVPKQLMQKKLHSLQVLHGELVMLVQKLPMRIPRVPTTSM